MSGLQIIICAIWLIMAVSLACGIDKRRNTHEAQTASLEERVSRLEERLNEMEGDGK